MRALSRGLSGTDYAQHHDFAQAAESYRRALIDTINGDILKYAHGKGVAPQTSDSTLWARIPPFIYEAPRAAWVLRRYSWALGVIVLWFAVAVGAGILASSSQATLASDVR